MHYKQAGCCSHLSILFDVNSQMKEFHVDDPCDLCSIKISGKDLREVGGTWFWLVAGKLMLGMIEDIKDLIHEG